MPRACDIQQSFFVAHNIGNSLSGLFRSKQLPQSLSIVKGRFAPP